MTSAKKSLKDLALFGGQPRFGEALHVGRPNIGDRSKFLQRVNDALDRRWLTNNGPLVQEFEKKVAAMHEVKHCIAICNGTVALEIVTRGLGMAGEVIVPSFTFIATPHSLKWQEITPVFCDVDPKTYNLDPSQVEKLITGKTTGVIGVHLWGRACDITALTEIARKHDLKLLFDAAHAFGCSYQGKMIGGYGDAEVLSFHGTKVLNTFEGGAILTNDDDLARRIRLMRNFGFLDYDRVGYLGINGKMNELSAAMGLTGLESFEQFRSDNRRNFQAYRRELDNIPGMRIIPYDETEKCNFQYVVLDVAAGAAGISRDLLNRILHAENVLTRRYFYPGCHRMEPYASLPQYRDCSLPETEKASEQLLALPTGTTVGESEIKAISQVIKFSVANAREISNSLGES